MATSTEETKAPSPAARLVTLPVLVLDKKGTVVTNLAKDDFTFEVDGHTQKIKSYESDQDLPLTLGILVEVSQSQTSVLDEERKATGVFLDQVVTTPAGRKPDEAFVLQFGHQAELLQDLTDSRSQLQAAVRQVETDSGTEPRHVSANPNDPNDPRNNGGKTDSQDGRARSGPSVVLYDAIYLSSNELIRKQTGRKALILLSDGVDQHSKKTIGEAIEAAQRAQTIVFSIYFKGQERRNFNDNNPNQRSDSYPGGGYPGGGYPGGGYPGGGYPGGGGGSYPNGGNSPGGNGGPGGQRGPMGGESHVPFVDGRKVLDRISRETGGRVFEVGRRQTLAEIYTQIADALRSEYRLTYLPDANAAVEGYHKVNLTLTKDKQATVQTPEGYYAEK